MSDFEYTAETLLDALDYLGISSIDPVVEACPGQWVISRRAWVRYNPVPRPSGAVLEARLLVDGDHGRVALLLLCFGIDGEIVSTTLDGAPVPAQDALRQWGMEAGFVA